MDTVAARGHPNSAILNRNAQRPAGKRFDSMLRMKTFRLTDHSRRVDQLGDLIDVLRREIDTAKTLRQKRRRKAHAPSKRR